MSAKKLHPLLKCPPGPNRGIGVLYIYAIVVISPTHPFTLPPRYDILMDGGWQLYIYSTEMIVKGSTTKRKEKCVKRKMFILQSSVKNDTHYAKIYWTSLYMWNAQFQIMNIKYARNPNPGALLLSLTIERFYSIFCITFFWCEQNGKF